MDLSTTLDQLRQTLGSDYQEPASFRAETTLTVPLSRLRETLEVCRQELGFDLLHDLSSVDHYGESPRFTIVYELTEVSDARHLRVVAALDEQEAVPTVRDLWATADWHEREVYDMMGLTFSGRGEVRRILMWEGYPFFPLRKDFPLAGKETEIPEVAFTRDAPLADGPFVTQPSTSRVHGEPRSRSADPS